MDFNKFECVKLAYDAIKAGGSFPVVLNVANDLAVDLFLNKKIAFLDIPKLIRNAMDDHNSLNSPTLSDILSLTKWTENYMNNKYLT